LFSKAKTAVSLSNSDEKIIEKCHGLEDPKLDELLPDFAVKRLRDEVEMIRGLCPKFNLQEYREGSLTPIYFGSAINNFGVQELLAGIRNYAPCPRPQSAEGRKVNPEEQKVSGFVFKIQANMDPKHRDRIAFFRLSSGHFKKGMKLKHIRSDKIITLSNPILFLARDRETAQEAFAGDIIGIPNHGNLRIGDTLTEGEFIKFTGVPSFAPELLKTVRPTDPLKAKHLGKALQQLAEEGAARVFKRRIGSDWIVGVIGQLQFDVMADRIRTEYEVPVIFEATSLYTARWVTADDKLKLKKFINANEAAIATDHDDDSVFLARNAWHLERAIEDYADIQFIKIKEHMQN
ncbi:MAG: EF-Tu/IF-2/RF-3 family GTPase, partial [Pseudomonadota bacterium]|nr:EF-Tu/IF-2/RF-3 family GTPase [Pseudomonadota bacterium]